MEKESKLKIKLWQLIVVGIAILLCVVVSLVLLKKSNNKNDANVNTGNEQNIIEENKAKNEIIIPEESNTINDETMNNGEKIHEEESSVDVEENQEKIVDKKSFLKEYEGFYGDETEDYISIFYVDDTTIDVDFGEYRLGGIEGKNVKIDQYGKGYFSKDDIADVDITLKNGKVYLKIDGAEDTYFKEKRFKNMEFTKTSTNIVTREEILKEINKIIASNYSDINKDIFDVYSSTSNYLTLILKPTCYIYEYDKIVESKYFTVDDIDHYYTIDKTKGKFILLKDLFNNNSKKIEQINNYIKKEIESQKSKWNPAEFENVSWPYSEFKTLDDSDYFENYFLINENKNVVNIRCLPYPSETLRNVGDLWIEVPLNLFN